VIETGRNRLFCVYAAAFLVPPFAHQCFQAGPLEIGCQAKPVVAGAHHDRVELLPFFCHDVAPSLNPTYIEACPSRLPAEQC
jgi:hypothetical protein